MVGYKGWTLETFLHSPQGQTIAMTILLTKDKVCLEDEDKIFEEVTRFYAKLFQTTRESGEIQHARVELLQHTTAQVIEAKKLDIERVPIGDKIRRIAQSMPKGEAPGLEWLIAKVLMEVGASFNTIALLWLSTSKVLVSCHTPQRWVSWK